MLYLGCHYIEDVTCTYGKFPTISDIIKHHMYDRVFLFVITGYCYTVGSFNLRAFYTRLYGVIDADLNDALYKIGTLFIYILPLIGFVSEDTIRLLHGAIAITFFVLAVIYFVGLAYFVIKHQDVLTPSEKKAIPYI
jgi:hypothetical protein